MAEEQTCGKGVAANAIVPERMGRVLSATADVLRNHIRSLDADDPAGRQEIAAYEHLVREHRAAADALQALAETMRSYRDLPPAPHDMAPLMDEASAETLAALVEAQRALGELMQQRAEEYGAMLEQMRGIE
jgi:uncharacterized protein Yka (UPF0111/DUF47 family)